MQEVIFIYGKEASHAYLSGAMIKRNTSLEMFKNVFWLALN